MRSCGISIKARGSYHKRRFLNDDSIGDKVMWDYFKGINTTNSNVSVQCVCKKECSDRHSQLCKNCQYNKGPEKRKSYYKPIK